MGEVVSFPVRGRLRLAARKRRKTLGVWKMRDLEGKRPRGHPKVRFGPRGKVLIAERQVWVERHTQELWVVKQLLPARKGFYPYDVVFARYRSRSIERHCLCEAGFRQSFETWDTWESSQAELMRKLDYCSKHDPTSPFRDLNNPAKTSRAFFGFDERGFRVE